MNTETLIDSLFRIDIATLNQLKSNMQTENAIELVINSYKLGRLHALAELKDKMQTAQKEHNAKTTSDTGEPVPHTEA